MIIRATGLRQLVRDIFKFKVKDDELSLLIINASNDIASERYIDIKKKECIKNGIKCDIKYFPESVKRYEILRYILQMQNKYTGVMIQDPVYKHLKYDELIVAVKPEKDVDGLHPYNQGLLYTKSSRTLIPCTAIGVVDLLHYNKVECSGKFVVIVGRGKLVADPLSKLLEKYGSTVVKIHTDTPEDLKIDLIAKADIIVSCAGKDLSSLINPESTNNLEALIGVGFRYENGKQLQDFDIYDNWSEDIIITDNINATGTATVSALLSNIYKAYTLNEDTQQNK